MSTKRLSLALLLSLLVPVAVLGQEELQARAALRARTRDQIVEKMVGIQEKATADPSSCTAAKGTLTLGQTVHPFLGDSGSCYDSGVWIDIWDFSAQGNSTLRATFSAQSPSLGTIHNGSTGDILVASSDVCGGLVTSCTFEYRVTSTGQYFFGFGSVSTQNYTLTLSIVTGGGGGGGVNLVPFKPSGWSDKIVVSNAPNTNTDSSPLGPTDTLYVDWAYANTGTAARPPVNRSVSLYIDGVFNESWFSSSSLEPDFYASIEDYSIGSLPAGTHTLRIKVDPDDEVAETNEQDNEYTKTITVGAGGGGGTCSPTSNSLCLNNNRFRVTTSWRKPDNTAGNGTGVELTADSGYFWFFNPANIEAVVKVLNACGLNPPRYWVFAAGLTNVEVSLTVTDTQNGTVKPYTNPLNTAFQPIQDTNAFATCP